MSFWLMLQRMTGVLWVHALSYTAWFHLLCITISVLTGGRRSCSILFAFRLSSVIPTNLIPLGFAPFSLKGRERGILCTHKCLSSDPFSCRRTLLDTSHDKMNPGTCWSHFCYLSKHDLCQIQHQKPLRSILLTDVSAHKDNLSLFLI